MSERRTIRLTPAQWCAVERAIDAALVDTAFDMTRKKEFRSLCVAFEKIKKARTPRC